MKSLIFVPVIILCSIVFSFAQEGTMENPKKVKGAPFWYEKYESKALLKFPVKDFHKYFRISAGAGSLEVSNHDENLIEVEAEILLTSNKQKKAKEFIDKFCELAFLEKGENITLKSFFDATVTKITKYGKVERSSIGSYLKNPGAKINLKVKVPKHLKLRISDDEGDIIISDLANELYIGDGGGDIILSNLMGKVKIKDYTGDIKVENVQNKLKIIDAGGDISVIGVKDSLYIRDDTGDIKVKDIAGEVVIKDDGGDIFVKNTDKSLYIRDDTGDINIENIKGSIKLKDDGGNIIAKNIGQNVDIRDDVGEIQLEDVALNYADKATVKIKDEGGNIHLINVKGKLILSDTRGKVFRKGSQ